MLPLLTAWAGNKPLPAHFSMAYLPWKPLPSSQKTGTGFFDAYHSLVKTSDPETAPCFRFTKQACGGSNRNGFIFSHYSDVQNQVRDVQAQLRARPRSAMDRGFQSNILQFNARAEHIPPSRFRAPSSKPPVKAPANAVRRRLGRPASAPVRYMDPIKVVDRPAVPPRSFRPFKAFLPPC